MFESAMRLVVLYLFASAPPAAGSTSGLLCVDEAHRNVQTATTGYTTLVAIADGLGLRLRASKEELSSEALAGCAVVVSAGARGAGKDRPMPERAAPAFTADEVAALARWTEAGGGLLVVTDHPPIGSAMAPLGTWLGIEMGNAFTEDPEHRGEEPGEIVFSRAGGLLGEHPILEGRNPAERVDRVSSFVGQSLALPPRSRALLVLGPRAQDRERQAPDGFTWSDPAPNDPLRPASGRAQALALEVASGRVVVLGEAAMFADAALAKHPGNRQLAANVLRWLSGQLQAGAPDHPLKPRTAP